MRASTERFEQDPGDLREACNRLPIFPLQRVVLLPGALLPLHVFEPRSRALVDHCLREHSLMGIATLRPGFESQYYGSPPVHPEVGIGRIVSHRRLSDGRINIVLRAVGRALVQDELTVDAPFRMVQARLLPEDDRGAAAALGRLRMLIVQIASASQATRREAGRLLDLAPHRFLDELAAKLIDDPDERRGYLRLNRTVERADWLAERLAVAVGSPGSSAEA